MIINGRDYRKGLTRKRYFITQSRRSMIPQIIR
jgi:hypothetical protein